MAANTIYKIEKTRKGRTKVIEGTLQELTKYFGYTLECGNSYNSKISRNPKTAAQLVKCLEMSVQETQGGCFEQDRYALVEETVTLKNTRKTDADAVKPDTNETVAKSDKPVKKGGIMSILVDAINEQLPDGEKVVSLGTPKYRILSDGRYVNEKGRYVSRAVVEAEVAAAAVAKGVKA